MDISRISAAMPVRTAFGEDNKKQITLPEPVATRIQNPTQDLEELQKAFNKLDDVEKTALVTAATILLISNPALAALTPSLVLIANKQLQPKEQLDKTA